MNTNELLSSFQHRLRQSKSGRVIVDASEVEHWSEGVFEVLQTAKLLKPEQPANVVECDGCEENCMMEVNIIPSTQSRTGRAFIVCDKRDDVGRVSVDFSRLERWVLTEAAIQKITSQFVVALDEKIKKFKSSLTFRTELTALLNDLSERAKAQRLPFDRNAMPGRKIDFQELARSYSVELQFTQSTFDDYLKGICAFKRGARETNFYRRLFPECFK